MSVEIGNPMQVYTEERMLQLLACVPVIHKKSSVKTIWTHTLLY